MSEDSDTPNVNLNIQLSDTSEDVKQVVFILSILLININIFFCLLNIKVITKMFYNIYFTIYNYFCSNEISYNVLTNDDELNI